MAGYDGDPDELVSGAYRPDDFGEYGLSPEQSAHLAAKILAEERHGMTPPPEARPNGNEHLSGPWYDGGN
jgi:hypothetical protein